MSIARAKPLPAALVPGRAGLVVRACIAAYLLLLVIVPLGALAGNALFIGPVAFWEAITGQQALDALALSLWTAALVALVQGVFGTATAWVLVRYRFKGRHFLSALVDLPFAIPTLVAGIMLVLLFGPRALLGRWFGGLGIDILFAPPAVILALLFVTTPFVVRAVEAVLLELDSAEEEAAHTLGAGNLMVFCRVILPAILPAIVMGMLQVFARAIAEFGSIVVVSGNIPHRTLTAAVLVFGEVERGRTGVAAAVSLVLLSFAFLLSLAVRRLRAGRQVA